MGSATLQCQGAFLLWYCQGGAGEGYMGSPSVPTWTFLPLSVKRVAAKVYEELTVCQACCFTCMISYNPPNRGRNQALSFFL